jgi:hypothetical protein
MARLICRIMGFVFIIVAIWGFIDGNNVLIFPVNAAHNWVHLLSGIAALAVGYYSEEASRIFAWAFGAVYLLVAILGFAHIPGIVDWLHLHDPNYPMYADDVLHLALAAIFFYAALASSNLIPGPRGLGHGGDPLTHGR